MLAGGAGDNLGVRANDLGQRIKAMLSPLEDVCRYREQRGEDHAMFDVKPRNKQAVPFTITIAPGGVNIDTPFFSVRELPVTEAQVAEQFVEAFLAGRMRRVSRLSNSGQSLATKTFLFDARGLPLFKRRSQGGFLSAFQSTAKRTRERFAAYRA